MMKAWPNGCQSIDVDRLKVDCMDKGMVIKTGLSPDTINKVVSWLIEWLIDWETAQLIRKIESIRSIANLPMDSSDQVAKLTTKPRIVSSTHFRCASLYSSIERFRSSAKSSEKTYCNIEKDQILRLTTEHDSNQREKQSYWSTKSRMNYKQKIKN